MKGYALAFVLVILGRVPLDSCGPYFEPFTGFSLIGPVLEQSENERPFRFRELRTTFDYRRPNYEADQQAARQRNLKEWRRYFGNKNLPLADIEHVIYDLPERAIQNRSRSSPGKKNRLIDHLQRSPDPDFWTYLGFLRRVSAATQLTGSVERQAEYQRLLNEGEANWRATTSARLKTRYGFQLVRLTRWQGQNVAAAYERFVEPYTAADPVMHSWSLAHRAGYLVYRQSVDSVAMGHAAFAEAFTLEPSRQRMYHQSVTIKSEVAWQRAFEHCPNDEVKAALYYLRALDERSNAAEEMAEIIRFHPEAWYLDNLLVRELQKVERLTLQHKIPKFRLKVDRQPGMSSIRRYGRNLLGIVENRNRLVDSGLWKSAECYLHFLLDDHATAADCFDQIPPTAPAHVRQQTELFHLALDLDRATAMTPKLEQRLEAAFLQNPMFQLPFDQDWGERDTYSFDWFSYRASWLYERAGRPGMAFLMLHQPVDVIFVQREDILRDLISMTKQPEMYPLLREYLVNSKHNPEWFTECKLSEVLAMLLFRSERFTDAVEVFRNCPDSEIVDPFGAYAALGISRTKKTARKVSRLAVAEELARLAELPEDDCERNFRMGNFWRNVSKFEVSWTLVDGFASVSNFDENCVVNHLPLTAVGKSYIYARGEDFPSYNCDYDYQDRANDFYRRALAGTDDPETIARILIQMLPPTDRFVRTSSNDSSDSVKRQNLLDRLASQHEDTEQYNYARSICAFID